MIAVALFGLALAGQTGPDVTFTCGAAAPFRVYIPGNRFTPAYRAEWEALRRNPSMLRFRDLAGAKVDDRLPGELVMSWQDNRSKASVRLVIRGYDAVAGRARYALEAAAPGEGAMERDRGDCTAHAEPRDVQLAPIPLSRLAAERQWFWCESPQTGDFVTVETANGETRVWLAGFGAGRDAVPIDDAAYFDDGTLKILKLRSKSAAGAEVTLRDVEHGYTTAELDIGHGKVKADCILMENPPAPPKAAGGAQ